MRYDSLPTHHFVRQRTTNTRIYHSIATSHNNSWIAGPLSPTSIPTSFRLPFHGLSPVPHTGLARNLVKLHSFCFEIKKKEARKAQLSLPRTKVRRIAQTSKTRNFWGGIICPPECLPFPSCQTMSWLRRLNSEDCKPFSSQ